jgi:hypothetical protein
MTRVGLVIGLALLALRAVSAQDTQPATPTPSPEAAVPATPAREASSPSPSPQPSVPALLPESNQLPAAPSATPPAAPHRPYDLIPEGPRPGPPPPSQNRPSATQQLADKIRFRELRTAAQRDPYAIKLWLTAKQAPTVEARREYLRAYYHYLGARMRELEPRLKAMIDAYEAASVAGSTQINIRPTIPLRDLEHEAAGPSKRSQ